MGQHKGLLTPETYFADVMHKPHQGPGRKVRFHGATSHLQHNYLSTTGQGRGNEREFLWESDQPCQLRRLSLIGL
jgi:hypothetical protein